MRQIKHSALYFLYLFFILQACNPAPEPSATTTTDTTAAPASNTDTSTMPMYDPSQDGLIVGAKFAKKLGDTLNVKFYELSLKPGDSATIHSHPDHTVYVLQGGQLRVTLNGTTTQIMDLKPGMGFISGPVSDVAKNVGKTTIKMVIADIYRPRGKSIQP